MARSRALRACERLKEKFPDSMFKIAVRERSVGRDHRPHDNSLLPQGCDVQVLWGRYHTKAKAPGEQKKGKKRMKIVGSVSIPQMPFWRF